MGNETWAAKSVRGLVKTVFLGCYIAFMWASIHHVATYFNSFEANSGDMVGSYLLAGAFDITALVTTMGVMFFRKSMPRSIQILVWCFIIGIAGYSFFINWEYAAHFQNTSLVLQATGETTPVYDQSGVLHYVPVMKQNIALLFINPFLASGFTIFSLIYSIIAEFFGSKPPTIEELQAKKAYLEETAMVLESIKQLEGKTKGKGLIQAAKEKALEIKSAVKEVTKHEETREESEDDQERNTDELEMGNSEETVEDVSRKAADKGEETTEKQEQHFLESEEARIIALHYEKALSWLMASGSTVSLKTVAETMNLSMKMLHNRVETKRIRATKNKEIVYKSSVIEWAIAEIIPKESSKRDRSDGEGNAQESTGKMLERTLAMLQDHPDTTDETLAEMLGMKRPASARFWRLKAMEMLKEREMVNG